MRRLASLAIGVALLGLAALALRGGGGVRWETRLPVNECGYWVQGTTSGPVLAMPRRPLADGFIKFNPVTGRDVCTPAGPLMVIDVETGRVIREVWDESVVVTDVLLSADGSRAAGVAKDGEGKQTLHLADLGTGKTCQIPLPGSFRYGHYSPDGELLLLAWRAKGGEPWLSILDAEDGRTLDRMAGGLAAFLGGWALLNTVEEPSKVIVWDLVNRRRAGEIAGGYVRFPDEVTADHPTRPIMLHGDDTQHIFQFNGPDAALLGKVKIDRWNHHCWAFDGETAIACERECQAGGVFAWDVHGRELWRQKLVTVECPSDIVTSGGRALVHGRGGVEMFELKTGRRVWSHPDHSLTLKQGFTPDGRWVALDDVERRRVRLLDAATGEGAGLNLPASTWHCDARFAGGRLWIATHRTGEDQPPDPWGWLPDWLRPRPAEPQWVYALSPGSDVPDFSLPLSPGKGEVIQEFVPQEDGSGVIVVSHSDAGHAVIRRHDISPRPAWRTPLGVLVGLAGLVLLLVAAWPFRKSAPPAEAPADPVGPA